MNTICEQDMNGMKSLLTLLGAPKVNPLSPILPVAPPFPPCTQQTSSSYSDSVPFGTFPDASLLNVRIILQNLGIEFICLNNLAER